MTSGDAGKANVEVELARHRLEAQQAQALADIEGVQAQVEAGELDEATAEELMARYRHEVASTSVELSSQSKNTDEAAPNRRRWAGAMLLIGAFILAGVLAAQAIQPRDEGTFITGGPDAAGGVSLDDVTNDQMEAVIAANPDLPEVAQMRIALANRYFEEPDFSAALELYLDGLNGQLRPDQRAQALGRVGWMTYVSGRTELAQQYVEEALLIDAEYDEGRFFLGLIELYGNGDAGAAIPLLEVLAARDDLPEDIRTQVDTALADARSQGAGN